MSEFNSITISRQEVRPFDYATLRQEAIGLAQKLSGKIWTDYNVHDPGVTILEQMVFTLTELGYKTGFDVEDYLASFDGNIDYESQALYAPALVMQEFPVTQDEYASFFKSRIYCERHFTKLRCYPQKVRFTTDDNGYYRVEIYMAGSVNDHVSGEIFERFWRLWRKWRCMGDYVSDLRIKWMGGEPNFVESDVRANIRSVDADDDEAEEIFPTGTHHDVTDFTPMIELFPTIYREGESAESLKGYLAPIEFVFKKFLDVLDHFPELFSIRGARSAKVFENLERYNLALDQMLAMYGVHFPKFSFIALPRLVSCKVAFLQHLPELLLHRVGYAWRRRVELMLGILRDRLDKLEIFNVDGLLVDEKVGRVHIVMFADDDLTRESLDDVEQFICNEIPAHLLPVIYWVPKRESHAFAELYKDWKFDGPMKLTMSPRMVDWLLAHKQFISKKVWL